MIIDETKILIYQLVALNIIFFSFGYLVGWLKNKIKQ